MGEAIYFCLMGFIKYIVIGVVALIAISVIAMSTAKSVPEGHVGILLTSGKADSQYVPPGLKFVMPFIQDVVLVKTQNIKTIVTVAAASKDLQAVTGTVVVNTVLNPNVAVKVYSSLGLGYQSTIIDPVVQEAAKQATAKFTVNEILNNREDLKTITLQQVKQRLANYNITLADLSITDVDFSAKVNQAIEAAATEKQNVQTAKNAELRIQIEANQTVAKAEGEQRAAIANANAVAQQQVLQAEGEATAIMLKANATKVQKELAYQAEAEGIKLIQEQLAKNPLYIEYLKANQWNGQLPSTLLGTTNQTATLLSVAPK